MEFLIVIGIIVFILYLCGVFNRRQSGTPTSPSRSQQSTYEPIRTKKDRNIFRPSEHVRSKPTKIKFKDNELSDSKIDLDLKDLVDALTGASLDPKLGLYQCRRCKVFYQTDSFEVIQSENGGRCVSCLHAEIESAAGRTKQRGRNVDVSVVTLQNYRNFAGRVITFEGMVQTVLISRRGTDYAVMFENTSWIRGFKMVVFRGDVSRIGGPPLLSSMIGHLVRVRGLLVRHKRFGYEIIVSDRAMILSVI